MKLTTWNINSVRIRTEQVAKFVAEQKPDVLCLQEIKCQTGEFPRAAFEAMGLPHLAIASRLPLETVKPLDVCREGHARCVAVKVSGIEVQNFYIPAGGDLPDRTLNKKFDHKLDFYERLTELAHARDPKTPMVMVGDLNVAPSEYDVWNHRYMLKVVSHTPIETEAMERLKVAGGFTDLVREAHGETERLASWWSYRAADFRQSNRGLRLDHIWVTPGLREAAFVNGKVDSRIHDDVREWDKPSDHAPVSAELAV